MDSTTPSSARSTRSIKLEDRSDTSHFKHSSIHYQVGNYERCINDHSDEGEMCIIQRCRFISLCCCECMGQSSKCYAVASLFLQIDECFVLLPAM